ncbi:putative anti-sigma-YlaC factor YlaD [Caldalkalibacillus uzonensis]|uniref:Anti-sigma-YlaC factor YlaD n=1 Tax=Caldalkalibacillus uzonensis TaxID=353224 RepID=A0ABU0CPK5_9BACI|nr:hypothetical protein [Caldalkalibacillus uzonensis]MDQ0338350.1 putative anti-sigma-YlaC factor YlaD [Caldalkalibacillus uzonensis]
MNHQQSLTEQCAIFRDLYADYQADHVEQETKQWMEEHLYQCGNCQEWITLGGTSQTAGEDQHEPGESFSVQQTSSVHSSSLTKEELKTIRTAKRMLWLGIGLVTALSVWVAFWFYF